MSEINDTKEGGSFQTRLIVVIVLGLITFLIKWFNLDIPIIGTEIVSDPREIFISLGAAFTGPLGGLAIGGVSSLPLIIQQEIMIAPADLIAHICIGLIAGYLYKKVVFARLRMPVLLVGWAALMVFYYACLALLAVVFIFVLYANSIPAIFGTELSFLQAFTAVAQGLVPEMVFTLLATTLALAALPERYRRPLW
jgi:LytS/YehU family sensor histidine kinase